jgi:hypothetical protein
MNLILALFMLFTDCTQEWYSPKCDDGDVTNGYWWFDEFWIPGYPDQDSWFTGMPPYASGGAVFYAPGVMEATAELRELSLEGYVDGVALMSPADIGSVVWIKRDEWEGPFLVVDCARRGDFYPVAVRRDEVVEVGFETAKKWGMAYGQYGNWGAHTWKIEVEVSKIPPEYLSWEPVDYREWFLDMVEFTDYDDRYLRPLYESPSTWRILGEWRTFSMPWITRLWLWLSQQTE